MKIIRQHSDIQSIFPEYFSKNKRHEIVLSKYTLFQKVSSEQIILYSFISDAIVLLSQNEYEKIITMAFDDDYLFEELYKNGFFINSSIDEYSLMVRQRQAIFANHPKTIKIVILPTTDCNARCGYCIGMSNPIESMSYETAKKVVNYIVDRAKEYENIRFDWYGGEPLLEQDLITFICEEVHKRLPHIKYSSVITSNLSCFDAETLENAIKNWHIQKINITIDGDEREHNMRKNYLNPKINGYKHTLDCIRNILDRQIMIFCRYNIDRNNFNNLKYALEDLKPFFNNKNFYFFVSPLRGENCCEEFYRTEEYNELFYKTGVLLNEFGIHNAIDSFVPKFKNGFCLAKSEHCIVIDPHGKIFRCNLDELIDQNSTGSVYKGLEKNDIYNEFISLELDETCKKCTYLPICQGGCPVQAKNSSNSNCKCDKFKFKVEAISHLLTKYYI
ncbi:MAG: SPASM domain-containing protein [Erysipelotrichales bacterium]|nr:SPASM domain-containing protein [Erysipelotrichales bacterium]